MNLAGSEMQGVFGGFWGDEVGMGGH